MAFAQLESLLLSWPDQLPEPCSRSNFLERAAVLIRQQHWLSAEALLLTPMDQAQRPQQLWLLGFLRLQRRTFGALASLLETVPERCWGGCPFWYLAMMLELGVEQRITHWQWNHQEFGKSGFEGLAAIFLALQANNYQLAQQHLNSFAAQDCLELQRLWADFYIRTDQRDAAQALFRKLLERCPQSQGLLLQFCEACSRLELGDDYVPVLRQALAVMGEHPLLLPMVTHVKLLKKEPALGLRSALSHQAWLSINRTGQRDHFVNKVTAYEMCGRAQWLDNLIMPELDFAKGQHRTFAANFIFQLASIQAPSARHLAQQLFAWMEYETHNRTSFTPEKEYSASRLRVGWVTPDVTHHPVSRFLLGILSANVSNDGLQHVVVGVSNNFVDPLTSLLPLFASCEGVSVLDLNRRNLAERVDQIRSLQCDVVVDLAGWTGGDFQQGFYQRVAPVQVNYLGYFASTHNPAMDVWLGDAGLFPEPLLEAHSEIVVRLPRPFLAWSPHPAFPEARVSVTAPPQRSGICFGSFNANRKLSDDTLRVWGQLLNRVPDASLVLKANASKDPFTQELLKRRMQYQGLDPDRVIWLPRAANDEEHLLQYAHMDVALDCFPNGGCTTTCEALWMGVPVITLTGRTYVGRMSTAVLRGAELDALCAESIEHYVDLAQAQAERLEWLRANRNHWRNQILNSPLGDARDLMHHLAICFRQLRLQATAP